MAQSIRTEGFVRQGAFWSNWWNCDVGQAYRVHVQPHNPQADLNISVKYTEGLVGAILGAWTPSLVAADLTRNRDGLVEFTARRPGQHTLVVGSAWGDTAFIVTITPLSRTTPPVRKAGVEQEVAPDRKAGVEQEEEEEEERVRLATRDGGWS